jgi:formylglycine-generating enzyme
VRSPPFAFLSLGFLLFAAVPLVAFGRDRGPLRPSEDVGEGPGADGDEPLRVGAIDDAREADGAEGDSDDAAEDDDDDEATADGTSGAGFLAQGDAGRRRPRGGCSHSMVRAGEYCIDRFEAPNRRGAHPLVMQSANDANAWCSEHKKRLCTEDEWIAACEGEERRSYPYGSEHVDGRCTDDKPWRAVDEPLLAKWPAPEARAHARELYQASPSGSKRKCVSSAGARDMTGNVEEWVVRTRDHANDWPYILIGCYWSGCYGGGKPTCHSTNNAHGPEFRFYETGFRCCKDAKRDAKKSPEE